MFYDIKDYLETCQISPENFSMLTHYDSSTFYAMLLMYGLLVVLITPLTLFSLMTFKIVLTKYKPKFLKMLFHGFLVSFVFTSISFPIVYNIYIEETEISNKSSEYKTIEVMYVYAKEFSEDIKKNENHLSFYKNLFKDEKILGCEEKFFTKEIFKNIKTKEDYALILKKHQSREQNIDIIKEINNIFN